MRDALRIHFRVQDVPLWQLSTPTNRWYFASVPWLMLLAISPLVLILFAGPRNLRRQFVWIAMVATCIVAINVGVATRLVPRYMHTVAWLFPLGLCAMAAQVGIRRVPKQSSSRITL